MTAVIHEGDVCDTSRRSAPKKILQFFFVGLLEVAFAEREHKTTPIQQVVGSPGYEPVTIDNNVCVGACYSYSIPKTQPAEPGELIGPYCDSCQPSEMKCYHVNLKADDKNLEGPKIMQKRVQIIMNCSCQSCDKIRKEDCEITDENTLELPENLFTENHSKFSFEEAPDLLNPPNHNSNELKSEEDSHKYQKHKINFEKYNNNVGLDPTQDNNIKIEKDLENLPVEFGIEGVPSHQKGNHIGMGIQQVHNTENEIIIEDLTKKHIDAKSGTNSQHGHHSGHHLGEPHHLHHLGEEQHVGLNVVHLIKGPHGSMVASPVEAKLNIDSDALKPNNEGVIIDYESHNNKNHHKVSEILDE
ncbi:hypothetical protein NQ317_010282 [Molorchus minor]|uniref:DAN domain-containing protein n=1 Tax=Molorchus minor TaxID=1323400 RepID=A0ABQ9J4B0_9CUCU|nr:hypothetical protein NQ317_010282 [Molorchus minor]